MSDRDNHTTIRVRNEVRDKLKAIQDGTDLTLSDIISNCLEVIEGTVVDDVENIHRESIAYDLQYLNLDDNSQKMRYITFKELSKSNVGDSFKANPNITVENYSTEDAEVIWKDENSIFLRLTQTIVEDENIRKLYSAIHIQLL